MEIHEILKTYRLKSGMTQEEVANQLFIQRATYTHYEAGRRKVDAAMFFNIIDVLGVDISVKEREKIELTLEKQKEDTRKEVIVSVYEENDLYDVDVFECIDGEKGELIQAGSMHTVQNERFTNETLKWILEDEIKEKYNVMDIEFLDFEDIEVKPPFQSGFGRRQVFTMSVSMISRMIRKHLFDKYGQKIDFRYELDPEYGEPECQFIFGTEKDNYQVLYELAKEYYPDKKEAIAVIEKELKPYYDVTNEKMEQILDEETNWKPKREEFGSEEAYYQKVKELFLEFFIGNYDNSTLEIDFYEVQMQIPELLINQLIGKKIRKHTRDDLYYDLIYLVSE